MREDRYEKAYRLRSEGKTWTEVGVEIGRAGDPSTPVTPHTARGAAGVHERRIRQERDKSESQKIAREQFAKLLPRAQIILKEIGVDNPADLYRYLRDGGSLSNLRSSTQGGIGDLERWLVDDGLRVPSGKKSNT